MKSRKLCRDAVVLIMFVTLLGSSSDRIFFSVVEPRVTACRVKNLMPQGLAGFSAVFFCPSPGFGCFGEIGGFRPLGKASRHAGVPNTCTGSKSGRVDQPFSVSACL
jgi:hypothetical protein